MSISSTIGGVVKEITAPSATVGGVVHEFDAIHTVSGGVLKKIFSRANWEFPTSLTWKVDKSIANYDTNSKVNSTSNNGLTVKYTAKSEILGSVEREGVKAPCICSDSFFMPKGGKIVYTPTSASGTGTSVRCRGAYLVNEAGEIVSGTSFVTSAPISSITLTAPSDGEYHIRLAGWSVTQTGTTTVSYTYYTATITCDITFSQP